MSDASNTSNETANKTNQADGPAFNGQCAFALSTGKVGVAGSAKHQVNDNGTTYLFSNPVARMLWRILPNRLDKANQAWATS